VLWKSKRTAALAGTLALVAAIAGPAASASAEVQTSEITSPASPTYTLYDETASSPDNTMLVAGTTTGSGNVALRCYLAAGSKEGFTQLAEVTPKEGRFEKAVEIGALGLHPCVLRAVPPGNSEPHAPGTEAEEAKDPFKGPRVAVSSFKTLTDANGLTDDYALGLGTLTGHLGLDSAGNCGLDHSSLISPESLAEGEEGLFHCAGALHKEQPLALGKAATRSEIVLDGADAYGPAAAGYWEERLKTTLPGAPALTVSKTFATSDGTATVTETDPLVRCSPQPTVFPPTTSSCREFVATGVQLERTWNTSHGDQVAAMTDRWTSTDGAAHSLSAIYSQGLVANEGAGGAYELPGTGGFVTTAPGQLVGVPAGAGAIYYKEDAAAEGVGHPVGAIVYDRTPSEPLSFVLGSHEAAGKESEFETPYAATVPATGGYTLATTYIQGAALAEVQALAQDALAGYQPPTVTISSPASGTKVSGASVTVSGTAGALGETPSLTVDGHPVSVGTGGLWSTSVALSPGANTIAAVATDALGLTAEKSIEVTYVKPPSKPHPPSPPRAREVGVASGSNGEVSFTVACNGSRGASCVVAADVTTVERSRHGRPVAVAAGLARPVAVAAGLARPVAVAAGLARPVAVAARHRRHHRRRPRLRPRPRTIQLTVGAATATIPAGGQAQISIALNAVGRSLLARFGHLPAHLLAEQVSGRQRRKFVAENLVVVPAPRRHHHRRRRHHHRHHR